jgi:hypothetical protein
MLVKVLCIVMKRSPGPPFGACPIANTAGKMARPARRAAAVSAAGIIQAFTEMLALFLRYEP